MQDFRLIRSASNDPSINLALEEYLIEQKEPVLYLRQNEPTIVIGRNQNPYKECNLKKMNEDGVHLMRRRSGGGAVYHDFGNLNFTIISKKYPTCVEENFDLVIKVLQEFGIEAKVSGRNDLEVDGKKISGSAFYEDEFVYCHHGTLLINVDTSKMANYLTVSKLKLQSKGVDSVKSRVANLVDFNKDVSIENIQKAFEKVTQKRVLILEEKDILNNNKIFEIIQKYRSWSWKFGESIEYNIELKDKYDWGLIEIDLQIENGFIRTSKIYTDCLINENFNELSILLKDKKFDKIHTYECIEKSIKNPQIKSDLKSLFNIE